MGSSFCRGVVHRTHQRAAARPARRRNSVTAHALEGCYFFGIGACVAGPIFFFGAGSPDVLVGSGGAEGAASWRARRVVSTSSDCWTARSRSRSLVLAGGASPEVALDRAAGVSAS
jgi:hypothetical protein